jgi:putative transposase
MKHLGQRYVQYINRTYQRSGTLWEGRFRSCLTESEEYALACYRYIELNPVRAGMVMRPQDYRWTSYHAAGLGKANALLTLQDEYRRPGKNDEERREAYRALCKVHMEPARIDEIRDATNGNFALGGKPFQQQIESTLGRRAIRGVSGRPAKQMQSNVR